MTDSSPQFTHKRFGRGYAAEQVDAFLATVHTALAQGAEVPNIRAVSFTSQMGGYNEQEVDDFLDELRRGTTGPGSGATGEGARVIVVDDLPEPPAFTVVGLFRRGYRVEDVDDFLAEVWSSVREGRKPPSVENVSFQSPRRGGYDELQVDDYLDLLSAALDQ